MQPKDVVEHWIQAFNEADADKIISFYAEAAVNH